MEPTNPGPESVPPVPPENNPPPGTPPPMPPAPEGAAGSTSSNPPPPMPGAPGAMPNKDERMWAMLIHLSGLVGAAVASFTLVPGNLVIPLILWLIKRDESPFINDQGKECLNFQITMTLVAAVSFALIIVFCVGIFLLSALGVYILILSIVAAVKSNEGVLYRYPLTLRLIT